MTRLNGLQRALPVVLMVGMVAGCAPSGQGGGSSTEGRPQIDSNRVLTIVTHAEPTTLMTHPAGPSNTGSTPASARGVFNAGLAQTDVRQRVTPELQEALPELNTGAWKVLSDGTMEVTHTLRQGLTWHDGVPLTASDWVFSWNLGKPFLPWRFVTDVVAVDPRTLLVRWDSPQPEADRGPGVPLPAHILEPRLIPGQPEAIANLPFWTREYVGVGPYKLEGWEPGAFIEVSGFAGYALGAPKIGRIKIQWSSNPNGVVASVLAGHAQLTVDQALPFEQGLTLKERWKEGQAVFSAGDPRRVDIQNDPQYAGGPELLDPRVRKALAHGVNKTALNDVLMAGQGTPVDALIPPWVPFYSDMEKVITKYPYDPTRTAQLLAEAGLSRGPGGLYQTAAGANFAPSLYAQAGGQFEREGLILIDGWRSLGIDAQIRLTSEIENADRVFRTTYPYMSSALATGSNAREMGAMTHFYGPHNADPGNRFSGVARTGFLNKDYDRLYDQSLASLDPNVRFSAIIEAMKLFTNLLPSIPLYYGTSVMGVASDLVVPDITNIATNNIGKINEFRWRS